MGKRNKLTASIRESGCLERDLLPGLPIVEICGNGRVLIENHRGIIKYECHDILVKIKCGCICVSGRELQIDRMSKNRLLITGRIHGVTLQRRTDDNAD